MTKWGVGPTFTLYSVIYCLLMLGLTGFYTPLFKITFLPHHMLVWFGIILILLGIPFYIISLVSVMRAFKNGRLVTSGVYGMCRHPVYAAWIVFFVPSIALIIHSWALLSAPLAMYFLAKILVNKEDVHLEKIFGQEYLTYKENVPAILPYGWFKKTT